MSSAEARRLARSIRRAGARAIQRTGPGRYRARVTSADPLVLEADGLGYDLDEDDVTIDVALASVVRDRGGLEVGDVLVLVDVSDPDDDDEDDLVALGLLGVSEDGPAPPSGGGTSVTIRRDVILHDTPLQEWPIDYTGPYPPDITLVTFDNGQEVEIEAELVYVTTPRRVIVRWGAPTTGKAYVTYYAADPS